MPEPDWALAGQVVQQAIDRMRLRNDAEVAATFGLDIETINKVVQNRYRRGPQRETLNKIDETLVRERIDDWYPGKTRAIAHGSDRKYTLRALTEDEYRRLQEMRGETK